METQERQKRGERSGTRGTREEEGDNCEIGGEVGEALGYKSMVSCAKGQKRETGEDSDRSRRASRRGVNGPPHPLSNRNTLTKHPDRPL